ncbi:MAG: prepilin-type N-terminal cleavage/methylation domain-containing protein [Candidatus Falkowbacteria bacterium]|nr:prepilin-type N-terminal cleavage/methylation domain-containing protein [Candidatus Falkowbacteria bacterium]
MTYLSKKNSRPGFSLPEVITSLAIIVIITAIFLANYKDASKRNDLASSAQNVVSDIHLAQSYALGLAEYNGDVPSGGWGLHFDNTTGNSDHYIIFADINSNKRYDSGEEVANSGGRTIYFSRDIKVKEFNHVTSPLDITFVPPDPITSITGGAGTSTEADIVLTELGKNTTKTITINFLGLTEVIE